MRDLNNPEPVASFPVPWYVCTMLRGETPGVPRLYAGPYSGVRKMLDLAATYAPRSVTAALIEAERLLATMQPYTVLELAVPYQVGEDIRALNNWADAMGAGSVEDPDNVRCRPNSNRIGRPGHCPFCGTPGGRGACCD